jgi:hypothetical protein
MRYIPLYFSGRLVMVIIALYRRPTGASLPDSGK